MDLITNCSGREAKLMYSQDIAKRKLLKEVNVVDEISNKKILDINDLRSHLKIVRVQNRQKGTNLVAKLFGPGSRKSSFKSFLNFS